MKNLIIILLSAALIQTAGISQSFNGYALYTAQNSQTTYLIDKDGTIAKTWSCNKNGNYTVFLKEDGNLLRQGVVNGAELNGAAAGGIIQEYDKDSKVIWEFTYSNADHRSHHDFAVLPNGNVLLTAWEVKTATEMMNAGYSSNSEKWPTHIIEVQQDGTGGKIVWEWHIWDHLIQDTDATKPNFGVVADHPELMDINVASSAKGGRPGSGGDWFHVNGIDYNESLDQIVFTSRYMSEIMIIDHSTTTEEAAGHKGGKAGKGGDFLFRYGNPSNYGSSASKVIAAAVHDPRWIKDGRPNAGYIQFFNNSGGNGNSSVVDAIKPQMDPDGYNYIFSNGSYLPNSNEWRHDCKTNASGQSASDRMSNGNIFVNLSREYMYEVDSNDNIIWQYSEGPAKAFRYECEYPGIIALLNNPCNVTNLSDLNKTEITLFPNPTTGSFSISGLDKKTKGFSVAVIDIYGKVVLSTKNQIEIDLNGISKGNYFVHILLENQSVFKKLSLMD